MWNTVVTTADSLAGRLLGGFLITCSGHPLMLTAGATVLLGLALIVWVDVVTDRPEARQEPERAIVLRR